MNIETILLIALLILQFAVLCGLRMALRDRRSSLKLPDVRRPLGIKDRPEIVALTAALSVAGSTRRRHDLADIVDLGLILLTVTASAFCLAMIWKVLSSAGAA